MAADHRRKLESVEIGHYNVDQHHCDVFFQEMFEGLAPRTRGDEILAEFREDRRVAQQLPGLVIDQQNVNRLLLIHRPIPCSAMQPHAQRR